MPKTEVWIFLLSHSKEKKAKSAVLFYRGFSYLAVLANQFSERQANTLGHSPSLFYVITPEYDRLGHL